MPGNAQPSSEEATDQFIEPRLAARRVLIALGLGLAVEFLFHGHAWGVSVPILTTLALTSLFYVAWREGIPVKLHSIGLGAVALAGAVLFVLRAEPFTSFLNILAILVSLALLVRAFRVEGLRAFGWLDYGLALIWVPLEAWLRPWRDLQAVQSRYLSGRGSRQGTLAIVRGLLLAFPVFLVFLLLLVSADLVFGQLVERALEWLNIELFFEWLGRIAVVLFSGLSFLGALVAALREAGDRRILAGSIDLGPRFLGFTESTIVLASVNLLFAVFVAVQVAYLFGGQANIAEAEFTYAEYARRGFGELVFAAFLILALIFTLETVTNRATERMERVFRLQSAALVAFTLVILASAYMRLLLYEQAYGFTRLRIQAHVFMVWLAVLLVGFVVLLGTRRLSWFVHLVGVAGLGFMLSINALNVDRLIVAENLRHMRVQEDLDSYYLSTLSADAIPAVRDALEVVPREDWRILVVDLACERRQFARILEERSWPSYRVPIWRAADLLAGADAELSAVELVEDESGYVKFVVDDYERYCYEGWYWE